MAGPWGDGLSGELASQIVRAALKAKVPIIDTALEYGDGRSERLIGKELAISNYAPIVVTKVPPKNDQWSDHSGNWEKAFPRDWVFSCAEKSKRNLGKPVIDVLLLHTWSKDWPFAAILSMLELKELGVCKKVGISVADFEACAALSVAEHIDYVEFVLNPTDQTAIDCLPSYCSKGVKTIVRCPFSSGSLASTWSEEKCFSSHDWRSSWVPSMWKKDQIRNSVEFARLSSQFGMEPWYASLKYILSFEGINYVVPGASKPEHVQSNVSVERDGSYCPPEFKRQVYDAWRSKLMVPVYNGGK